MKECCFHGCANKRSCATRKLKSFHSIPLDLDQRKLWLTALKMDINTPPDQTKNWTVCSDHFEPDDFYPKEQPKDATPEKRPSKRKSKTKRNPRKERIILKPHAVPRTTTLQELPSSSWSSKMQTPEKAADAQGGEAVETDEDIPDFRGAQSSTPAKSIPIQGGESSQTASPILPAQMISEPEFGEAVEGAEGGNVSEAVVGGCRYKRQHNFYLSTPPHQQQEPRPRTSLSGKYLARTPTFFLESAAEAGMDKQMTILNESYGNMDIEEDSESSDDGQEPENKDSDLSFCPPSQAASSSSESADAEEPPCWDPTRWWIVDESHLMQLFNFCSQCGNKTMMRTPHIVGGSRLVVKWECEGGCSGSWSSSPQVPKRVADNNLLCSAAIFFTGATYTDIFEWAQLLNLQIPQKTLFYSIQKNYLIPVIHAAYKDYNKEIIERLKQRSAAGERIDLCGDGRSDSPGYSAKYTTYSFQDDVTKEVVLFELVQVSESTSSAAMELIGFQRGLEKLDYLGVKVGLIATDRSPSIKKLMKSEKYHGVLHEFDAWHVGKNMKKKLLAGGIKACNRPLQPWIKAINNHLYWSCEMSAGDPEKCVNQWKSLVHHICGVHRWEEDNVEHTCQHREYTAEEQHKKKWLTTDSSAFRVVQSIVLDPNILRDLKQMSHFKHTGSLEVFHSTMLKYTPKRIHFFYDSMLARTMLAVIDHNLNVGREKSTTKTGKEKLKIQFSKASHKYVVKYQFEDTQQLSFRLELLDRVKELSKDEPLVRQEEKGKKKFPRGNIAKEPRPDLTVLMSQVSDRFSHQKK